MCMIFLILGEDSLALLFKILNIIGEVVVMSVEVRFNPDEVFYAAYTLNSDAEDFCEALTLLQDEVELVRHSWRGEGADFFLRVFDHWYGAAVDLAKVLAVISDTVRRSGQQIEATTEESARKIRSDFSALPSNGGGEGLVF